MQISTNERWLQSHFERCWPMLEKAVKKMREPYGREYVWSRIVDGTAQFFPGANCAVVTDIDTRLDGSKVLNGWLAAGDRAEIEIITTIAENWGRKQGCVLSRCVQRKGFAKKPLPGYRMTAVVMEKEL